MMANNRFLPSLLFSFILFGCTHDATAVSLTEAIKNKWITVNIRGIDYRSDSVYRSSFYGHCMVLTCKNLKATPIQITESPGRFFLPDDSSLQRMVLTDGIHISLGANKELTIPLYAMCTEANDGSPGDRNVYSPGEMAPPQLLSLVNFVAQHHFQNDAAQQAIWCITDRHSPYEIYSDDTTISNQLRKYVCSLAGYQYVKDDGVPKTSPRFRIVDGSFTYSIQRSKKVDLIIYNEAGQEVKKLVANEDQPAGNYTYTYHFNLPINEDALLKQSLLIKFYLNGVLIAERKHVLGS